MLLLIHDALREALIPAEASGFGVDDPPPCDYAMSESLQGRKPRWAARAVAVYGDLTAGRRARVMRWARESVVDRRLQPAERFRCCFR